MLKQRRRLEGKTNYTKRKRLLDSGNARIIVRKSNKFITIQYIESFEAQDSVKVGINSKELLEYGWPAEKQGSLKSLGAAYLTGLLFAKKVKQMKPAILDTGLIRSTKGSRIYAAVKGIIDGGFKIPCSPEVFPKEDSINKVEYRDFFDKVKKKIGEK